MFVLELHMIIKKTLYKLGFEEQENYVIVTQWDYITKEIIICFKREEK